MSDRISHYVQSERTFTEDELAELNRLIERLKQEPLMFIHYETPCQNDMTAMRGQFAIKQRWIPVSERLPENEQEVLFSTKTGRVHLGRYHNDNSVNQWYSSLDKMRAWNNVVNAWMPLPEPYEEKHED